MRTLIEPSRQVPVAHEADVVVCGGGPGGFPAAIAAARHGARTVLIERHGYLGGLATAGLVSPVLGHTASRSNTPIVTGILREVTERMHALGGAPTWEQTLEERRIRFDAEALKVVLDALCAEAGVTLMLHTTFSSVLTEGERIRAVIVENKTGRQAVTGQVFVDATGDADIAARAGAPTTHGRPYDGLGESMGSFFHLAGYQPLTEEQARALRERIEHEMEARRFRFYNAGLLGRNTYHTDHSAPNMTRFSGNSDDAGHMTRGELSVRQDVWELVRYLRANVEGFENCYVQQTSAQIGPRESRQVVGPYALTGDDVHAGRKFGDGVARGSWWIDIHCPYGHTWPVHLCIAECPKAEDCPYWAAEHEHMFSRDALYPPDGDWYDIPYRSLLSVGVGNLLASGRCISATHEGMAGARVMAIRQGVSPSEVDVVELQDALRADGQLV